MKDVEVAGDSIVCACARGVDASGGPSLSWRARRRRGRSDWGRRGGSLQRGQREACRGLPRARRELVRSVGPCLASCGAFASSGCFSFEFVQDVVGAARELARDGQDGGLSGLAARLDAPVQGTVRASPIAGLVRGLHERPAQLRRAVLGEVAAPRRLPGVGDDRVEAGGTDRGAGAAKALRLAEFGEDVAGEDRADPVDRLERLAAPVEGVRLSVCQGSRSPKWILNESNAELQW